MFELYSEYENRWKESAKRHFENHKAIVKEEDDITIVDWRNKNGSSEYYVRYLLDNDTLIVTGDLGYFIFRQHGNKLSLEKCKNWVNQLEYIAEKCEASGKNDLYTYSYDLAYARLEQFEEEQRQIISEEVYADDVKEDLLYRLEMLIQDIKDEDFQITTEMVYAAHYIGIETEDIYEIADYGRIISPRFIAVMMGLHIIKRVLPAAKRKEK